MPIYATARCGHGWGTADELGSSSKVLGGSCEQRLVPNTAQPSQSQKPDRSLQERGLINCGHL